MLDQFNSLIDEANLKFSLAVESESSTPEERKRLVEEANSLVQDAFAVLDGYN
jgi:hypothetical protein